MKFILITTAIFAASTIACAQNVNKPNVLLIMCDDLNDFITGLGGHPQAKTPAIAALAASGTTFTRAYTNYPACVPSRNSLIHGIYPHNATSAWKAWSKNPTFRDSKTIMTHFRDNGYHVVGTGKVDHYHNPGEWTRFFNKADYGPFWRTDDTAVAHPGVPAPYREIGSVDGSFGSIESAIAADPNGWHYAPAWKKPAKQMTHDPKEGHLTPDKRNANLVKDLLSGKTKGLKEPFFMGVGFIRPHTPLHVEQKFFDKFPLDQIQLTDIKENDAEDTHLASVVDTKNAKGFRYFDALKKAYPGDEGLRRFTQAYLASIAAADANVKTILHALKDTGYADNTIVVFTSDHGWQMGEKDYVFKGSLWEESARVPMIIRAPGTTPPGSRSETPVSLVDIYPTLIDLCGLPMPKPIGKHAHSLDGHSMKPLLQDPKSGMWSGPDAALTTSRATDAKWDDERNNHHSVRSKRYRYIRYNNGKEELYDHKNDPNEWTNLATNPEYANVRAEHLQYLKDLTGFTFP